MSSRALFFLVMFALVVPVWSTQRHRVTGLVLKVDAQHRTVLISQDAIPGYMEAMTMSYRVNEPKELDGLKPGAKTEFTLVAGETSSYISNVHVLEYSSLDRDPALAKRLEVLDDAMRSRTGSVPRLSIGQLVPDFSLVNQNNQIVPLSQFRGKVVAITFIYTRCPLPDYCFRLSNNFAQLQKRFKDRIGRDLILLTITFDPEHDRPEVLAKYADVWKASAGGWQFLTGSLGSVKQVCSMFGMNFWPDEGLMTHSLHTVIVDPDRKLVANIEGNQFTAIQLGDLISATLNRGHRQPRPQ